MRQTFFRITSPSRLPTYIGGRYRYLHRHTALCFSFLKKRPAVTSYTTHQKRPYIPRLSHPFLTGDFRLSCNLTAIHVTAKVFFSIFYISLRDLGTWPVDNA